MQIIYIFYFFPLNNTACYLADRNKSTQLTKYCEKYMKNFNIWLIAAASFSSTACDREPAVGPEIHDTKYLAVNSAGVALGPEIAPGDCTLDQFTGLTWEVKTDQPGMRYAENTYSWYNPTEAHGGELDYRGEANKGDCTGSDCDTFAYTVAVNEIVLCGYSDWRLPTRDELGSISDPRKNQSPPSINTRYFPNTQAGEYWSGNDYQFQWNAAWVWGFQNGLDRVEWKASPRYVRLVRGQARQVTRVKD